MKNTALITGASSGIGKELAWIHAERGGDLVLVARRTSLLDELKHDIQSKYGVVIKTISKDLSKSGAAKEIFKEVKNEGIEINILMNNAGFGLRGKFYELSWERQNQMMQLNMIALSDLTYLFLPEMIKRNNGKILNTSSTASLMPGPLQAVYFATKAYVSFLSNALSEELSDTNITVTNLMPGATATEFAKTAKLDGTDLFQKSASARKVAEEGYEAMLRGKLDVISGITFNQKLMMSMIPISPKKILLKQVRRMQEVK